MRSTNLVQWILVLIAISADGLTEAATVRNFLKKLRTTVTETANTLFIPPLPEDDNEPVAEEARVSPSAIEGQGPTFTCPTMQPEQMCITEWAPVMCDGVCQYGNSCEASASGYDADAQCVPYDETIELIPQTNTTADDTVEDCPIMPAGSFCSLYWEPFICDERCSYGNRCEASTSGYNVATQCRPGEF